MFDTALTAESLAQWVNSSLARREPLAAHKPIFRPGGRERLLEVAISFVHLLNTAAAEWRSRQFFYYLAEMAFQVSGLFTEGDPEIASEVVLHVLRERGLTPKVSEQKALEELAHAICISDRERLACLLEDYYRPRRWWQRLIFWKFLKYASRLVKLSSQPERRTLDTVPPGESPDCGLQPQPVRNDTSPAPDRLEEVKTRISQIQGAIPSHLARYLRAIPVDGDRDRLVLLCEKPLTQEELDTLFSFLPREAVEISFAKPEDYPALVGQFGDLLDLYYPDVQPPILLVPADDSR